MNVEGVSCHPEEQHSGRSVVPRCERDITCTATFFRKRGAETEDPFWPFVERFAQIQQIVTLVLDSLCEGV